MKEFIQNRFKQLEEEIALFDEMGIKPVRKMSGIISAVKTALTDLKADVKEHPFSGEAEEIHFFKYEKPRFVAEQLYAVERYTIAGDKPLGDELLVRNYYEQELRFIKRFLDGHRFLYQYYLLDGNELDHALFSRNAEPPALLLPDVPDTDPDFSTAGDFLFAKFMACERLQDYLVGLLYPSAHQALPAAARMSWPGDKTELIEMGYGLYCWLRAHKSAVTIAEVIEWLELSFGITLPRHYRRFAEIKMRKVSSRTKFWDEGRELLQKYMDDGDV